MPAGSSRVQRLDPFALPVRFEDIDHTADQQARVVEIHREGVVLRRALCGIKMAVSLPLSAYRGVAVRIEPPTAETPAAVALVLEHFDPALSLTLYRAADGSDIVAEWQSWGHALGMPLLIAEPGGELREPFDRIGSVRIANPVSRRRRRSAIAVRRPSMPLRRQMRSLPIAAVVHQGEREIIARN
jgi:Family of unknown function (DUF6101)